MVSIRRKLVLAKRRRTQPRDRPTCPNSACPYYLSDKWVQRIQADEFGNRVPGQYICDYFAEGKPPGCCQQFVWLKEDQDIRRANAEERSKPSEKERERRRYDSRTTESRHQPSWPVGWRKPEWESQ